MRRLVVVGLAMLSGCGGGGTTGTNYSDPPPMAVIVATPTPKASPAADAVDNVVTDSTPVVNDVEVPGNTM